MGTLSNVTTRRGELNPPSIRFAPDAFPEAKSSQTGVSVRYVPEPKSTESSSLIGPRPHMPAHTEHLTETTRYDETRTVTDKYVDWLRHLFKSEPATQVFAGVYLTGILPIKKYKAQSLVLIPRKNVNSPALVVELKYNKDAQAAISQIKNRNYPQKISEYTGDILLVGINYDKNTKHHECEIERWRL